jgi:hypothetical protein
MKTLRQKILRLAGLPLGLLLLSSGCERSHPLQVVIEGQEAVGQPVFVDELPAGSVVEVTTEGGSRVANLRIEDATARERLRVGALRVPAEGRVLIRTEAVAEGAALLPRGARVPTTSAAGYWVRKYSGEKTVLTAGVAVAGLVVLWLVFRSLLGTVGLILSGALAAVFTQAVHGRLVPTIASLLQSGESTAPTTAAPTAPASGGLGAAEGMIQEWVSSRPSPEVVTWCAVFLVAFLAVNLLLGKATRAWRR